MPIDAYSLCPCGTGKKIKFCCPDLLGELQKIERMVQGEQNLACLSHIEALRSRYPDRACLLAIKAMLLRAAGQWQEMLGNATTFVKEHPDNPIALAEAAMAAVVGRDGRVAMDALQRALAASDGEIQSLVYEAMGMVAQLLLSEGQWLAGRGLLQLQMALNEEDEQPLEMLVELNRLPSVPLLLKDDLHIGACPDDVSWKTRFDEALAPAASGNWQAAAERIAALAEEVADSPVIWRNLATLRGRLADDRGCIDALRKLAAVESSLEDAVEAEATAMLLEDNPLGDPVDIVSATWTINDVELFQAALTMESRMVEIPQDPAARGEDDDPPPRATYQILDRPIPDKPEDLTLQTVSRLLGSAMLFGRQTDREARIEVVGVTRGDLQQITELLKATAGDAFNPDLVEEEVVAGTSASRQLLQRSWRTPQGTTAEQLETLAAAYTREALLNHWPNRELGIFVGKSAREVADDESYKVKLLAAVMVLQSWSEPAQSKFDFNELRNELGLPVLEPIDPDEVDLNTLRLPRLSRVNVEKASDEALCAGYRRALGFSATAALEKFARAILERDSLSGSPERIRAYRTLAETERNPEKAIQYIQQGRAAAESEGLSCASWDLMELSFRFSRGEADHMQRLVAHLQERHIDEPGVADALMRFLVGVGAIHPDGTPVAPPPREQLPMGAAAETQAEPGKIWTPDSQEPGGEKKIWTPS